MHIFFSGISGMAIGPLALIAKQVGYKVSGSDKQDSQYIQYLMSSGVHNIHIGQTTEAIAETHARRPIDWYVYSSAIEKENPNHPEIVFAKNHNIKTSKRDELLNLILKEKGLKLVAVAGTHGKTTTTAMLIWLLKELGLPVSYSVGAKISFGDMGQYIEESEYFIYECDEFDRNFLHFKPYLSLISGVTWDHHEIFPSLEDYKQAFCQFINQSEYTMLWQSTLDYLRLAASNSTLALSTDEPKIQEITLPGRYNRENAWLAIQAAAKITNKSYDQLIVLMNKFPGVHRRMEQITEGLYSDEAHTPDKIRGGMSMALEIAKKRSQNLIVVYEPLTNRRQHYMLDDYGDCFRGAAKVYWLPSYLAREDPSQRVIPPEELISHLQDPSIAEPRERNADLKKTIQKHLGQGEMVVAMAGGGGNSLDEWIRKEFS